MTQTANTFHVDCPSCAATFPVDPGKVPDGGVLARCSACEGVFRVQKPEPAFGDEPPTEFGGGLTPGSLSHEEPTEVASAAASEADWEMDQAPAELPGQSAMDNGAGYLAEEPAAFDDSLAEVTDQAATFADTAVDVSDEPSGFSDEGSDLSGAFADTAAPATEEPGVFGDAEGGTFGEPTAAEDAFVEESAAFAGAEEALTESAAFPAAADAVIDEPGTFGDATADDPEPTDAAAAVAPEPAAPPVFGKRDPKEKAQRLARVLVSDMITYNRDRHTQALAQGTLVEDFEDEIKKSWAEYVDQVGEDVAESTPFFTDALNDILAEGEQLF